ncbi:MAG: hypothetical protein ACK4UN_13825, partial [Limisphaerales bacterium]
MSQAGVSSSEVSRLVIEEILQAVMKAIPKVFGRIGDGFKEIGTQTVQQTTGAAKEIKSLFKK